MSTHTKEAPKRSLGIVFAHGGFHPPSCFDTAKQRLEAAGFAPVIAVRHPSLGANPDATVDDDARNIQKELAPFLDGEGRQFLAISHSYGGTPLTIATQGHSVAERAAQGKKGGIRAVVFVTSNMPAHRGASSLSMLPPGLDIIDMDNGLVTANAKARQAFYGPDMDESEANGYMATLLPHSQKALFGPVPFALEDLKTPAYYILCEKDQTIPLATQESIISTIPTLKRVLRNPGGHSAFITHVDKFVEQVNEIADDIERE